MPGIFNVRPRLKAFHYGTLYMMLRKEPARMWFIIFGIIFFIESIILTFFGIKKKNGMLIYIGIVFGIMTLGIVILKLTGH